MTEFFLELRDRNEILFWFFIFHIVWSLVLLFPSILSTQRFKGANSYHKPLKFVLSTTLYSAAMGWYTIYLNEAILVIWFNWIIVVTLGFENVYITLQAVRNRASHFNNESATGKLMFVLMAIAATIATLATGWMGYLFIFKSGLNLQPHYLLAIQAAIVLFVVFALEGLIIGRNGGHTRGTEDGGKGLPFLNWSLRFGDLRVAHFVGMHALQLLPLLAAFVLTSVVSIWIAIVLYTALAVLVFVQAIQKKPVLPTELTLTNDAI